MADADLFLDMMAGLQHLDLLPVWTSWALNPKPYTLNPTPKP